MSFQKPDPNTQILSDLRLDIARQTEVLKRIEALLKQIVPEEPKQ
ncbi:hypothetical protein FBZ86_1373 [Gluconacetobacter diazotrophicus]|nr:hypothetical protein FBZ86_1373 [Gluconacetobacter diazotrophicus]